MEGALPDLPFDDGAFDLALSSHLLFLYSEQFDLGFHVRALEEMLRVAAEVRVFPLLQGGRLPLAGAPRRVDRGDAVAARRGGRQRCRIAGRKRDNRAGGVRVSAGRESNAAAAAEANTGTLTGSWTC